VKLIRLQHFLAKAGVASRRHAEELIVEGRVRVNGKVVTELGTKIDPAKDTLTVGGRKVRPEDLVYLVMFKPREVVTTLSDPEGRTTVKDLLPREHVERVFPVGRLDYNTEGVLLLTNDGELMHRLLHPSRHVPKVYHAKLKGKVPLEKLERLRRGVRLFSGMTKPAEAFVLDETAKNTWIELRLTEGRTHQVKEMAEAIGHPVLKLIRVAFANITLEGLKPGDTRTLTTREVEELRKMAGLGSLSQAKRARHPERNPHARARERERSAAGEAQPTRSATMHRRHQGARGLSGAKGTGGPLGARGTGAGGVRGKAAAAGATGRGAPLGGTGTGTVGLRGKGAGAGAKGPGSVVGAKGKRGGAGGKNPGIAARIKRKAGPAGSRRS